MLINNHHHRRVNFPSGPSSPSHSCVPARGISSYVRSSHPLTIDHLPANPIPSSSSTSTTTTSNDEPTSTPALELYSYEEEMTCPLAFIHFNSPLRCYFCYLDLLLLQTEHVYVCMSCAFFFFSLLFFFLARRSTPAMCGNGCWDPMCTCVLAFMATGCPIFSGWFNDNVRYV